MLDLKGKTLKAGMMTASLLLGPSAFSQSEPAEETKEPAASQEEADTNTAEPTTAAPEATPPAPAVPVAPSTPAKDASASKAQERIQVTGSRIRRVEAENTAPVAVITKKEIEKSGTASLGDLFRKSASSAPLGTLDGPSGTTVAGAASINLLGIGGDRTLVLLNGKRLPSLSGTNSVNIDNIPTALVDRIEILAGGASAVYGADAVGGVVNIVTRKDFTGTEVSAFANVPIQAGGEEQSYNVTQGINIGDDVNLALTAGYRHKNPIDKRNRDLDYAKPGRENGASFSPPGGYSYSPIDVDATTGAVTFGDYLPSANCPTSNRITTIPGSPDLYCAGARKQFPEELIPERDEWFAGATLNVTKGDWTTSALLNYSRSMITSNTNHPATAANPISGRGPILSKARAVELGVLSADSTAEYVELLVPIPEYPDQIFRTTYNSLVSGVYLSGEAVPTWKTDFGLSYAQSEGITESMKIRNSDKLADLFTNPDTDFGADPAYVPIDPARNPALLEGALGDLKAKEKNETFSADAFASKEVASLPGGELSIGFGVARTYETFKQTPDSKDLAFNSSGGPLYFGSAADQGKGVRDTTSVFTEVHAPVTKQILVEGALRFDNYSDFDATVNYGLGTKYTIVPEFALRARAASSFKAPPLSYIHQRGGGGYLSANDEKYCNYENDVNNGTCDLANPRDSKYVYNPGNPDLEEETGVNYTAGFVYEPIANLNLIADYYWIDLKDTFAQDDLQQIVDDWYAANPDSLVGGVINENTIAVDPASGVITQVGRPYRNLGSLQVQAASTKASYRGNFGTYLYSVESDHFRMISYKTKESQFTPKRQQVRYLGIPAWRWNNSVSFGIKNHEGTFTARTIGKQGKDPDGANDANRNTRIGEYTEYDIVYSGELPSDTSLEIGVNNIMNTLGGVEAGNALGSQDIVDNSLYQYTGRAYFAKLTQRF